MFDGVDEISRITTRGHAINATPKMVMYAPVRKATRAVGGAEAHSLKAGCVVRKEN